MSSEQSRYPFLSAKMFCAQVFSAASVNLAGVVAGHPLDTVKIRLQHVGTEKIGVFDLCRQIIKHEGVKGFYKGALPPMVGTVGFSSVVFTFTELINMRLKDSGFSAGTNKFISGAISAWFSLLIVCPVEMLKC